jgi:hypothetical protein
VQLEPSAPRFDAKKAAKDVCAQIEAGNDSASGLQWDGECVRVKPSSFTPGDGPKQTVTGRRSRFRFAIIKEMEAAGWSLVSPNGTWLKFAKTKPMDVGE